MHVEYTLLIDEHTWVISCNSVDYPGFAFNSYQFDDRSTTCEFFIEKVKEIVAKSQQEVDRVVSDYKKVENVSDLYTCCKLAVEMSKLPIKVFNNYKDGEVEVKFVLFSTSRDETKRKVDGFAETFFELKKIL